ncbi:RagB/SusD family nutrient uptake outer membrane protein [Hymenobacter sp. ASUV-10]|uniref:RagB/SusD family nutrient uptake outer membrane protein n=1 Tax=Hymenobacter aranciens TaxID=3063996 RepID=A0ABT9BED5_9BACT|nr:RagB/SusD family nutrient uptake outer membrane protein [Hymenobacter sp. ASUV-10]MDO7876636.1 RagB/SusD family nutrient uptake outer membrane protein [Hymenobacter sp. ASUV-10]
MSTYSSNLLKRLLLGTMLLGSISACEVITQDPPIALTPDQAFGDADRIGKSAVGMYDGLQNLEFLGGRALIYGDVRSDDTALSPYFNTVADPAALLANNAYARDAWTGGYRTIFGVNYFLDRLAENTGKTTAALEAQYIAEGKYIRALTYFHLLNLYAQPYNFTANASHPGLPMPLKASADVVQAFAPEQQLARSSVAEVYTQIIKDLTESIAGLPETSTDDFARVGRATKDASRALLSRVYLYQGNYTAAAASAAEIINGGRHSLEASPATPFTDGSYNSNTESIFSVAHNTADNPNTNNALGQHYGPDNRADIWVTPYARIDASLFPATDLRRTELLTSEGNIPAATERVYTLKYSNSSFDYAPISRYAEVLLNRAEALAQLDAGVSGDAITLLNQVRDRSNPTAAPAYAATDFADKQALIDAILLERRLELAFEGHRYYDLLRYRRNPPRVNYGEDKAVFPIPLIDLQQDPNLVPNPGY